MKKEHNQDQGTQSKNTDIPGEWVGFIIHKSLILPTHPQTTRIENKMAKHGRY
jgi:hypothetical protein